jgi:hypothetical protein
MRMADALVCSSPLQLTGIFRRGRVTLPFFPEKPRIAIPAVDMVMMGQAILYLFSGQRAPDGGMGNDFLKTLMSEDRPQGAHLRAWVAHFGTPPLEIMRAVRPFLPSHLLPPIILYFCYSL